MERATIRRVFAITVAAAIALGIGPKMLSKTNKTSDFGTTAALALRASPTALADDDVCSNATLRGAFAFTSTGFITAPAALAGPFAIVGRQTFDGNGSFTAAATVSQNGKIIPVNLEGLYTANPNCTGTFTAHISPVDITTHLFFVIDDDGKEFQVIQSDPGVVVTGIARKQ